MYARIEYGERGTSFFRDAGSFCTAPGGLSLLRILVKIEWEQLGIFTIGA